MSYSEKIKSFRKQAGISQSEMAELIGISQAAYGKIESGFTKSISIDIGKSIAEALNLSFVDLFEIDDIGLQSQNANRIKELQDRVKDLEERLAERKITIDLLLKEKEIYKKSVFASIEGYFISRAIEIEKNIENAKDEKTRIYYQNQKNELEKNKQREIDNYLFMGFFSKEDIESFKKELAAHYGSLSKS